jgi:hypothetical protein
MVTHLPVASRERRPSGGHTEGIAHMTAQPTLKQLAKTVRLDVTDGAQLDYDRQSDWQRQANGYRCTLRYRGRRYAFDFWQGVGITGDPTAEGCLDCLLSDAQAGEQTFAEFCAEFGYDTDSRAAEATWRACRKTAVGMRRLLGDDFETFLFADRN